MKHNNHFPLVRPNICTSLLLVYVWWIVATPHLRFEILQVVHFERLIVFATSIAIIFAHRTGKRTSLITWALLLFFLTLFLSYLLSPYRDFWNSQTWAQDYWKVVVLYFLILYGITDRSQLFTWIIGIGIVTFLYELYSWFDFLQGGSYVYQQGMRRMIGVWSGGGLGAANAFGSMSLYAIPHAMFWYEMSNRRLERVIAISAIGLCCASILFTGVRGALVAAVVYFGFYFRKHLFRPKTLTMVVLVIAIVISILPGVYQERYLSIVRKTPETEIRSDEEARAAVVAQHSAESRIMGLTDGWKLMNRRPVIGYGPGASAAARHEINSEFVAKENLQLHNLYGQIMSESGILGSLIFVGLIAVVLSNSRRIVRGGMSESETEKVFRFIYSLTMMMLMYGMFTHSLYNPRWMFIFATYALATNVLRTNTLARKTRIERARPNYNKQSS